MPSERALILGSNGFLGANLVLTAPEEILVSTQARMPIGVTGHDQHFVAELTTRDSLHHLLNQAAPTMVVNCAALADVDRCEREPELADALNRELPEALAIGCRQRDVQLIHISTDAVFGGGHGPYGPDDPVSPVNEYGRSKAAGEAAVLNNNSQAIVVRTNIVGWSPTGTRSLLEYFYGRLSTGLPAIGFTDVFFRPVSVLEIWPGLLQWLSDVRCSRQGGIRHATGPELLSKYDFGLRVAIRYGFDPGLVTPASVSDSGLDAVRSRLLDVVPSALNRPSAEWWTSTTVEESLDQLIAAAGGGLRESLAAFVSAHEGVGA